MATDPELRAHQEWLGYLQPVGLVVSPPALAAAQAFVNRNIIPQHRRFLEWVAEVPIVGQTDDVAAVRDLPGMLVDVFGWEPADLVGGLGASRCPIPSKSPCRSTTRPCGRRTPCASWSPTPRAPAAG
ncbi:MAG TPA: hypothetical protein VF590_06730 [Isosphaeraceae bacterium]|jgi:hypothetical protein